jgi:hypothetical protein
MDVTPRTPGSAGNEASFHNLTLSGLEFESFVDALMALAGGGQAGATQISSEIARFTTVATVGDSAALPPSQAGLTVMVINHGAKPMQMYGAGIDTINDQTSTVGVPQMVNSVVIYVCTVAGKWYANGLGTGYSGAFETQSYADGLTAHAGGGQGSATLITTMISRFTTVATAADSAILPTGVAGMSMTVINAAGVNAMAVFPDTGSTINGGSANASVSVAAGKTVTFFTTLAGAWHMMLSA